MYNALVACRTGMGSSMLLKIKVDQVVKENGYDISVEHSNLDAIEGGNWDFIVTMADITDDVKNKVPYCIAIQNLMDKQEIKKGIEGFLEFRSKK
ncbi:PTS sugar transporter subunit IIB [Clostridium fungisolvens]|uniref:Ascorbate-specific PTS system EIIB component n=1 Tax=Clostridium fungisolvens TaxID=1604897 RepID=A0A6V8SEI0_9CLOT|nr:PTS sugar transporter subunit IIB [Clostridium fungisolvens]GFP75634.1 Ascorbate-specific PTS system EIIB component [Clostridium fungisolvens]